MGSFLPDRFEAMILGKMPFARSKRASDRFGRNGLAAINGTAWVDFGHRIFQLDLSFRLRSRDFAKQSEDATIFPRRLKVGRAAVLDPGRKMMFIGYAIVPVAILLIVAALRSFGINQEYQRGVLFRLGSGPIDLRGAI